MDASVLTAIGGIGLFLLGMTVLTDGLRALAGPALRRLLARFTRTPLRGAVAGALATAVVQSSSATTISAIGFVNAELLTFPQGLGIVFGANIGTTITGWLVAILGFRISLGTIVMPLVLVGVLMKVFGGPTIRNAGWALAGFAVLFVGIEGLQQGMAGFEGVVTPENFPPDTLFGRLQLVLIGIAITMVTQSSSAGVATALAALGAGAVTFPQAAAMVIGMDVGTTFTAVMATVGGSAAARRTGFAHVIYNVMTAAIAFLMLGPFSALVASSVAGSAGGAQVTLVAFHTLFNIVGVVLIVPFAGPFARLVTALVPERGPALTRRLDERLLNDPDLAMAAATATVVDIARALTEITTDLLAPQGVRAVERSRLDTIRAALDATRRFVEQLPRDAGTPDLRSRYATVMHLLDHLNRLAHRCGQHERIASLATEHQLHRLSGILRGAAQGLRTGDPAMAEARLERVRRLMGEQHRRYRSRMVNAVAERRIDTETTLRRLDSVRWLRRVAHHLWRIAHHLGALERGTDAVRADEVALELDAD